MESKTFSAPLVLINLEVNKTYIMNLLKAIHIANAALQAVSQDIVLLPSCHIKKHREIEPGLYGLKTEHCNY